MDSARTDSCFSCGARVPDVGGPTHPYMLSSPGCWAVFGDVLAREYSDPAYRSRHRLTVDAYAVQHPGEPSRSSCRSVALHLIGLFAVLEDGVPPHEATAILQRIADGELSFRWLDPPAKLGSVTVADVWEAATAEAHTAAVEQWARAAWQAWSVHHDTIRRWSATVG